MQWQLADWAGLAALDELALQTHPERARLAVLASVGCMQVGDIASARRLASLARYWGCDRRWALQVMAAGAHNSLGRAAALLDGETPRALGHFASAVGAPGPAADSAARARLSLETGRLGLLPAPAAASAGAGPRLPGLRTGPGPRPTGSGPLATRIATHDLGTAWAANSVNTVVFRHHGVLTVEGRQFTSFYADEQTIRVVCRDLATDQIEVADLPGRYGLRDAHNSISMGIDRLGHVHLCYDHHGTKLRYRRSQLPWSVGSWTDELSMTGAHEREVTYPSFVQPPDRFGDSPLMLLYRDGHWDNGTARLKVYDETTQCWLDRPEAVLSGAGHRPWTSNAYWHHPVRGRDGSLHLAFVWRSRAPGEDARIINVNVCYACSFDDGLTWASTRGQPLAMPITQVTAETVHAIAPGRNLINQGGMALDSANRPHIVFYADDDDGVPQYQHLWFDGRRWRHGVISRRSEPFVLRGGGTLRIPISRPEIVIDDNDVAFVVYRGDLTHDRMVVCRLQPPDYDLNAASSSVLWDEDLEQAEPVIDRLRWHEDRVLSLLLQRNRQLDQDRVDHPLQSPITLVDFRLS